MIGRSDHQAGCGCLIMIAAACAGVLLAVFAVLSLGGCALVVVSADGGKPQLSAWPLGVRVSRGSADAIGVKAWSLGVWQSCYAGGVGVASSFCVVIDARTCTAMIMDGRGARPAARQLLGRVAQQAQAECLSNPLSKPEGEQ